MKITFNSTRRISEDGFTIRLCHEGETYEIADTAARIAINCGWAYKTVENPNAIKPMSVILFEAFTPPSEPKF